jgi:hypothetical protein
VWNTSKADLAGAFAELNRALRRAGVKPTRTAKEAAELHIQRREQRDTDLLGGSRTLAERFDAKLADKVRRVFWGCDYREPSGRWAGGETFCNVEVHRGAAVESKIEKAWSKNQKWSGNNVNHTIGVPRCWLSRVYRRGLDVVQGKLVLDAGEPLDAPDGVLLCKAKWVAQARGLALQMTAGYVAARGDHAALGATRRSAVGALCALEAD